MTVEMDLNHIYESIEWELMSYTAHDNSICVRYQSRRLMWIPKDHDDESLSLYLEVLIIQWPQGSINPISIKMEMEIIHSLPL